MFRTAAGPAPPRDRFLSYLRQRRVGGPTTTIQTMDDLKRTILHRVVLPQDARPRLTPELVKSHLDTLSFNDLYLLSDIKGLPVDATLAQLEKGFREVVKKAGMCGWDDHYLSRLFDYAGDNVEVVRTYIRKCCFFPSPNVEFFAILRMCQWHPVRDALQTHGDQPDQLPPRFWETSIPTVCRECFPNRLWTLDRVSDWKKFFSYLDASPAFDDTTILHIVEMIRPAGRLVRMTPATASRRENDPAISPLVPPPKWLELSNHHIPVATIMTLLRTQPWLETHSVMDLTIQSMEHAGGPLLVDCPFYSPVSFRLASGDSVWIPTTAFYTALCDPLPRMQYHAEHDTVTIPRQKHHFRIYFRLVNGQFLRMTRDLFQAQQKWFKRSVESSIANMKPVSTQRILERPLCQFEEGWLRTLREKEEAILLQIISTAGMLPDHVSWDFGKLAKRIETACTDGECVSLERYWHHIFTMHCLFSDRSLFRDCRRIFAERLKHGMLRLDRLSSAPIRVLIPELWAFTPDEAEQVEKLYRHRGERFVRDRMVEHVGFFFPRSITERKPPSTILYSINEEPVHLPYPSFALGGDPRMMIWDASGRMYSLAEPETWGAQLRHTVDTFFDADTFDMASPEMAACMSSLVEFVTVAAPTPSVGSTATVAHQPLPVQDAPPQWVLPQFEQYMMEELVM